MSVMAEQSRDLAKFDRELMPPLSIPQPEESPEPADAPPPPFSARGRVRWTPRRVRRMVPSKLKEVVVAILGALEDPPRRGAARRRRLPGPHPWPPQAPPHALPRSGDNAPAIAPASDSVRGARREGAD